MDSNNVSCAMRYMAIQREYDIDGWLQPLDVDQHRTEMLRLLRCGAQAYTKRFVYDTKGVAEFTAAIQSFRSSLGSLSMNQELRNLVIEDVVRKLKFVHILTTADDLERAEVLRELDGSPNDMLLATAEAVVACPIESRSCSNVNTSDDLKAHMENALIGFGLTDWKVVIDPTLVPKAAVNGPMKRIRVQSSLALDQEEVYRLVVHEIGGHVLRWANSMHQHEPWAQVPLGSVVPAEEGLALCREEEFGLLDNQMLRVYSSRVIAVNIAATSGIMDVARAIVPYIGEKAAVDTAIRVKRGLCDPNNPGGQTKDWCYLGGLQQAREIRTRDPHLFRLLNCVKWPFGSLPIVSYLASTGDLIGPVWVPSAQQLGID